MEPRFVSYKTDNSKIIYLACRNMSIKEKIFVNAKNGLGRLVAFSAVSLLTVQSFAADFVTGANATLDIEPGARSAALGSATMAVDGDYLGLISNPYQLANTRYTWASFSHTAYYEDTQYDFASAVFPLSEGQGLGVAFSRFGADDIPYIKEGEPLPEGSDYNTLSIADWVFSVSWGKRLTDRIDLGVSFHTLYRDMDQTGWGFRGDAGIRFNAFERFYLSGLLKGWTSSAASWESGEFEYSAPELYLAINYSVPVKYLYGTLGMYWQGAGIFQREARDMDFDTDEDAGGRIWEDPFDWLSGGHGGLEFNFDFGLSLRVGLSSFTTWQSVTAGAGLVIANFLRVDYAFESHPVFSPVHRVSVSVCPYLFSHHPDPERGHLSQTDAAKSVLSEEPDTQETGVSSETLTETSPESTDDVESESAPETTDSQEPAPAGGLFWEE